MPLEALVCPHCRTWVEGSGRFVKCPSCGKRFRAADARLDPTGATQAQANFAFEHAPERVTDAWDAGQAQVPPTREADAPTEYEEPNRDSSEDSYEWQTETSTASEPAPTPVESGAPDAPADHQRQILRWALTGAFIALIFVGRQFLSGELFLLAFALLAAAQWLTRGSRDSS